MLVDGELTLYMERGGKTLLAWPADPDGRPMDDPRLRPAAEALAAAARAGSLGTVTVERVNGTSALTSPTAPSWKKRASSQPLAAYASEREPWETGPAEPRRVRGAVNCATSHPRPAPAIRPNPPALRRPAPDPCHP